MRSSVAIRLASVLVALGLRPFAGAADCNINGVPDADEIASGAAADCNLNGVPDECEALPPERRFVTPREFRTGQGPMRLVVQDFDRDGDPDAAVLTFFEIQIFDNVGRGSFALVQTLSIGRTPVALAAADLDGDGILDLAQLNEDSHDLRIFIGGGDAHFREDGTYGIEIRGTDLEPIDLNGDALPDLSISDKDNPRIALLLNDGRGGFAMTKGVEVGGPQHRLAVGDVDGNGVPDLCVSMPGRLVILARALDGSFLTPSDVTAPTYALCDPVPCDFDSDDDLDILVHGDNAAYVLRNDGKGAFPASDTYLLTGRPAHCAVGDFNSDGHSDVVLAIAGENFADDADHRVALLLSGGSGAIGAPQYLIAGYRPSQAVPADVDGDQDLDLLVTNEQSGGLMIIGNRGGADFAAPRSMQVGGPTEVLIGDLDGDRLPDLALVGASSAGISAFWGRGGGQFDLGLAFQNAKDPRSLKTGDLDGDGNADLVYADRERNLVCLLRGRGDRTFEEQLVSLRRSRPFALALEDLDGDGDPDAAVTNEDVPGISILVNDGAGALVRGRDVILGESVQALEALHLDSDGKMDLVAGTPTKLLALRAQGDGFFDAAKEIAPMQGSPLMAADLDGDGIEDLVLLSAGLSILWGEGEGHFKRVGYPTVGGPAKRCAAGDVDGDGLADLAVTVAGDSFQHVALLLNEGNRVFTFPLVFPAGREPWGVAIGDADGDGRGDIAATSFAGEGLTLIIQREISIGGSDCNANGVPDECELPSRDCDRDGVLDDCEVSGLPVDYSDSTRYAITTFPNCLAADDLDLDGDIDIVTGSGNYEIALFWNEGKGRYGASAGLGITGTNTVAIADLDGDRAPDILVGQGAPASVTVLHGDRQGGFTVASTVPQDVQPIVLRAADLSGDGAPDVAFVAENSAHVWVLLNDGSGKLEDAATYAVGRGPIDLLAADLDADGDLDIVSADSESSTLTILRNDASGTYAPGGTIALEGQPWSVAAADFDADGDADLVAASTSFPEGALVLFRNAADGSFEEGEELGTPLLPRKVFAADLDGDLHPDILAAGRYDVWKGPEGTVLGVYINDGKGGFTLRGPVRVGGDASAIILQDMDGNLVPDVVLAERDSVAVILGRIANAPHDCNSNGFPDECDIANGVSLDRNRDGTPDECESMRFHRGDSNGDGNMDVSDALFTLRFIFSDGPPPACLESADADNDDRLDITDPILILNYLFLSGRPPPAPGPPTSPCGHDAPSGDLSSLGCRSYRC